MRDITLGETIDFKFTTTEPDTGAPATLSGTPAISAYVGNSTTQITAGITLSVDFDGVTGLNNVRVVASSGNGYTDNSDVALIITTGTVDGNSAVGYKVAEFTIGRSAAYTRLGAPAGASVSADVAAVKAQTAAIEADTQDLQTQVGTDGAGLTAIPWNAAWDAEVQSECTDALNAYDPPTRAELTSDISGLNDLSQADIRTAVGLASSNLDTQLAALPTASENADAVWDEDLTGHTTEDTAGEILQNVSGGGGSGATAQEVWEYATRTLTAIDEDSTTLDIDAAVRAAVGLSSANLDTQLSVIDTVVDRIEVDTQDLQAQVGTDGAGLTSIPWNSAWDAEVQSECADALSAYDPPTNAEMVARTLAAANYATATALQTVDDEIATIDGNVDAIRAKTDSLTFTVAGQVDANIQYVNDTEVGGDGAPGTEWGPA